MKSRFIISEYPIKAACEIYNLLIAFFLFSRFKKKIEIAKTMRFCFTKNLFYIEGEHKKRCDVNNDSKYGKYINNFKKLSKLNN